MFPEFSKTKVLFLSHCTACCFSIPKIQHLVTSSCICLQKKICNAYFVYDVYGVYESHVDPWLIDPCQNVGLFHKSDSVKMYIMVSNGGCYWCKTSTESLIKLTVIVYHCLLYEEYMTSSLSSSQKPHIVIPFTPAFFFDCLLCSSSNVQWLYHSDLQNAVILPFSNAHLKNHKPALPKVLKKKVFKAKLKSSFLWC